MQTMYLRLQTVAAVRSGFRTTESSILATTVNRAFAHIEHNDNLLAFCA